jgi:hypothetical protein
MQRHGGLYRDVEVCVTCHTAGSEDANSTDTGDVTPQTIEMGTMVHKLHSGRHLPSVLGIGTNADGTRNYAATPVPYVLGSGHVDYSFVGFPASPAFRIGMPRDQGYSTLTAAQQGVENQTRMGVVDCAACHGDPDGAGPLTVPDLGDNAYAKPSRKECGSCHDDVDWTKPYVSNQAKHLAQPDDTSCATGGCHAVAGNESAVKDSHFYSLKNPTLNPGLKVALTAFSEAGANDGNGKVDPGEKVSVSFTMKDDTGNDVPAASLKALFLVMSGPTTNRNLILANTAFPLAALPAGPTYTVNLPEAVSLEAAGTAANNGAIESFATARTPHWNVAGALTEVYERTATAGGSTTLATLAAAGQNFVDVASVASFARSDSLVLEDGTANKEYQQILYVDGTRLWVAAPLKRAHGAGAGAVEVTLTKKTVTTDYTVTAATGTVAEAAAASFGAGHDVVVSYTTDFVMPAVYPPPFNDSPDIDETWGKWAGKPIVPGTYTFGIWGNRAVVANAGWGADATSYTTASLPATKDFLVGSATAIVPYANIASGDLCNRCHGDLMFHGGARRSFDACILCHGTAGPEDNPQYMAAAAPATKANTINYRSLMHKVHMGRQLPDANTYSVVTLSASKPYPNNFSVVTFQNNMYPAEPNETKSCTSCHGEKNVAWQVPADRSHPSQQSAPMQPWRTACTGCHAATSTNAHFEAMSPGGNESCVVCHGPAREFSVEISHKEW